MRPFANAPLIDVETQRKVFLWVLGMLAEEGLLKGNTVSVDGTTLEANAALRSIVRRDNGQGYDDFLKGLAKESVIQTPTREQLAKLDRKRKKKGSNDDWKNPHDPDAQITKMKDGRTHLAHKAEHAVDLETGAVLAVTLQPATAGDTNTLHETLTQCGEHIREVAADTNNKAEQLNPEGPAEVVLDEGYHSNDVLIVLKEVAVRSYCSEPDRGRRNWIGKEEEKSAVYQNRRRIRASAESACCASVASESNEASPTCTKPEPCEEPTYGGTTTSSNGCSFMPVRSILAW